MDWKFIVLAAVLAAIAAVIAYRFAQSKTNAAVIAAEAKIDEANRSAERIVSEATRNAENAKKEAVLSAKEEILQLKANSEAEEKKRKQELQGIENRIMQREETL
ncbi:MAG: Rnase Y domain-containing protein, partial [Coriobacteriaceae bacterium]|nr:Rnase Y domain-containing protein [Coriobacteriaceae bacterium]